MKKKKILLGLALTAFCSICGLTSSVSSSTENKNLSVNATYGVDDVITIENRTLTYNNVTKQANSYVIFPDGSTFTGKQFIASQPGIYKIVYQALFNNHLEQEEQIITILNYGKNMFSNSSTSGSISYGMVKENSCVNSNLKGVILTTKGQSVFTFNKEIDLNNLDKTKPFIEGMILTKEQKKSDFDNFVITLTDVKNSNEYLEIKATNSGLINTGGLGMYVLSKTANQRWGGLEGNKYHSDGNWGSAIYSSFLGMLREGCSPLPFKFSFDTNELALYGYPSDPNPAGAKLALSNDFNNKDYYGSALWDGFTSGKVKLTLQMNNVSGGSASMLISSCGGIDLQNDLLEDDKSPTINIKLPGENIPTGEINKPFKIFDAEISDNMFDNIGYETYVTYNDTVSDKDIDVTKIGNTFTPKKAGTYTIHYVAKDCFNNTASKTIEVIVHDQVQHIILDVDTTTIFKDIFDYVQITPLNEINTFGGNGNIQLECNVYDSEFNKIEIVNDKFLLEKLGKYYIVYKASDYIGNVTYATVEVNSNAINEPKSIKEITIAPAFIKGLNYELETFEGVEVFNNNICTVNPKIYVNDVETTTFVASGNSVNIKYVYEGSSGSKTYEFTKEVRDGNHGGAIDQYFYGVNFDTELHQQHILMKSSTNFSAQFLNPINSSVFDFGFSFVENKSNFEYFYIRLTNYQNPNESVTFYIKRISNNTCKIKIGANGEESTIQSGSGVFYIYYNSVNKTLLNDSGIDIALATKNDNNEPLNSYFGAYVTVGFTGNNIESHIILNELCNQTLGHGQLYECETCGNWYNEFDLVDGCCPIDTSNKLEVDLNKFNFDFVKPSIYIDGDISSIQTVGNHIELPKVYSFDVLSSISEEIVKVSFKNNIDDYVYTHLFTCAIDDFKTLYLENSGVYLLEYFIKDNANQTNNESKYTKVIYSYEKVAPTLSVDKLKAAYKVGSIINIPNYRVNENSGIYTVEVYLYLPNDEMRLLLVDESGKVTSLLNMNDETYPNTFKVVGNDKAFVVDKKGDYQLKVVAYDQFYNRTVNVQTFNVR